jgi:hypothetical protein
MVRLGAIQYETQVSLPRAMPLQQELATKGYTQVRCAVSSSDCDSLIARLEFAMNGDDANVLQSRGKKYGSRDLIHVLPEVCEIPRREPLREMLLEVLGHQAGLVRVLYFDKPPTRGWSLPWHKDESIAVKDNARPSQIFRRPTIKSGIPHVCAPESLLRTMLTMRLHLDAMTADNGPLSVVPGSHESDTPSPGTPVEIHADAGDVLFMRPLLTHASSQPKVGTHLHRRIIHFEFAASPLLADDFEWHDYHPLRQSPIEHIPSSKG